MPRLTDSEYQRRRDALRADWDASGTLIRRLASDQQWALHDFYLFTRSLNEAGLHTARTRALTTDPDLTTRAGLAYRSFARLLAAQHRRTPDAGKTPRPAAHRTPRRTSHGPLVVTSVDVAEPDPHAMARLLLAIARDQAKKDDQ